MSDIAERIQAQSKEQEQKKQWFDNLVANLRKDELMLEQNLASEEQKSFYKTIIFGKPEDRIKEFRTFSAQYYIEMILTDYLKELKRREALDKISLYVNLTDTKVRTWAIIDNDDEQTEKNVILAAAKTNHEFQDSGFSISNTIIEASDDYSIPPQYVKLSH